MKLTMHERVTDVESGRLPEADSIQHGKILQYQSPVYEGARALDGEPDWLPLPNQISPVKLKSKKN